MEPKMFSEAVRMKLGMIIRSSLVRPSKLPDARENGNIDIAGRWVLCGAHKKSSPDYTTYVLLYI